MKRISLLLMTFCVIVLSAWAQGSLSFESRNLDLGTITRAAPLNFVFNFRNNSAVPVTIQSVQLPSAKMHVDYPRHALVSGEAGQIRVQFDTQDCYPGRTRKPLRVRTSGGEVRLFFSALVSEEIPARQVRRDDGISWIRVYENGKYGALDAAGNRVLPSAFNTLYVNRSHFVGTQADRLLCYDHSGCQTLDLAATGAVDLGKKLLVQNTQGVQALYDYDGRCLIPFESGFYHLDWNTIGEAVYFYGHKDGFGFYFNAAGQQVMKFADVSKLTVLHYVAGRFVRTECNPLLFGGTGKIEFYDIHNRLTHSFSSNENTFMLPFLDRVGDIVSFEYVVVNGVRDAQDRVVGNVLDYEQTENPFVVR